MVLGDRSLQTLKRPPALPTRPCSQQRVGVLARARRSTALVLFLGMLLGIVLETPTVAQTPADAGPEAAEGSARWAETNPAPKTSTPPVTLAPDPDDEYLPEGAKPGQLSPSALQQVRLRAAQLDQEAEAAYAQGQGDLAYQKWFRALRLLQYGQADEEIIALGKIGARAWQEARAEEAQAIAQRLLVLDQLTDPQTKAVRTPEDLEAILTTQKNLALAHEQVGALDPAVARYEWLLEKNEELKRAPAQENAVDKLAQLNIARLNYPDAADYTQRQLMLLRGRPPRQRQPLVETTLLERLAYLQEQNRDWPRAIATQQELLGRYSAASQDPLTQAKGPALLVAIAHNQVKAGEALEATQTYQAAYRAAQALQQFQISHEALANLAMLYRVRSQPDDALTVYEILRRVDELSYNLFGLLQTYEQIGQIQSAQGNTVAAEQAFRQALHVAQQMDYRSAEIQAQLERLLNP